MSHPDEHSEFLYGHADLNYRSASSLPLPIDTAHGRAPLPNRAGVGTNVVTQKDEIAHEQVRFPLLDGRARKDAGIVASLDQNGYQHAEHVSQMFDGNHDWWCALFASLFAPLCCRTFGG